MATTYLDFDCDLLGDFDSTSITGTGSMGTETTYQDEGAGCIWGDVNSGAGSAYGLVALAVNIGLGDYFHAAVSLWFNDDATFPTGNPPDMSDHAAPWWLISSPSHLGVRMLETFDGDSAHQWELHSNAGGGSDAVVFEPGHLRSAWKRYHVYGYVHDSAGYLQLWVDGVKLAEITGIDTYPGAVYDTVAAGLIARGNVTGTDIGFGVDAIVINDDLSPLPPGSGEGAPLRRRIISPWHNDQSTCRGDT